MKHILGQDRALGILRNALRTGRVHHAWIFSGPAGVGKFTTALALARILLDPDATPGPDGVPTGDPEGETARLIAAGTHPDLHVIRKELAKFSDNKQLWTKKLANIPLDVLREHMIGGKTGDDRMHDGPAYLTPMRGHGKVFIVDEAELVDPNGQNALLKTLEEPPPSTYLVLVTSRPARLLPTIRSRCQHVRFTTLDDASMAEWLRLHGPDVGDDERRWLFEYAGGSPGVAVLAATYGFRAWDEALRPHLAQLERGEFPSQFGSTMGELVEGFATAWVRNHANASKDAANKQGARHLFSVLATGVRRRMAGAATDGGDPEPLVALVERIRDAERQLASNVNQKQVFEDLAARWWSALAPTA